MDEMVALRKWAVEQARNCGEHSDSTGVIAEADRIFSYVLLGRQQVEARITSAVVDSPLPGAGRA